MRFFVKPPKSKMTCFSKDLTTTDFNNYLLYYKSEKTLVSNQGELGWMHLICFLALFISDLIDSKSIYNHFTQSIRLITVPLYIYIIFVTQNSTKRIAELGDIGCFHWELGYSPYWFTIEIYIFYANLGVLLLMLLWVQFLPGLSLKSKRTSINYIIDAMKKLHTFDHEKYDDSEAGVLKDDLFQQEDT